MTIPLPLAEYSFNGPLDTDSLIKDLTANGHDFSIGPTFGNSARTADGLGHTGRGLTQTLTDVTPGPPIFGQTNNRTIMAWIKQSSIPTGWAWEWLVSSINSGAWGFLFLNGTWQIQARTNTSNFVRCIAPTPPSTNVYHHICGTYDMSNIRLYIDGVLVATTAYAGPLYASADLLRVMDQTGTSTVMDDVRIFDAALNVTDINTYMNTPAGTAVSSGPNIYFSNGAQSSGIYEMTGGGVLVQRDSLITIK